VVEHTNVK
jgi:hypothetical protein